MANKLLNSEFIVLAQKIHNDKYNYLKTNYVNSITKVLITCPIHGDFKQTPHGHLTGRGCIHCSILKRSKNRSSNTTDFIIKANDIHGGRYDYTNTKYVRHDKKLIITCKIHGNFKQTPNNHLVYGCNLCAIRLRGINHKKSLIDFVGRANIVHSNIYDYSNSKYTGSRSKINISCIKHGSFTQMACNHLSGNGCPKCKTSKGQTEVAEFVNSIGISDLVINTRKVIAPMEIDIYSPSMKIGIEFCGLYWHSEENGKKSNYHANKHKACEGIGVKLITVFEDEWKNSRGKVENIIRSVFSKSPVNEVVNGLVINEVTWCTAKAFLNANHLLNSGKPGTYLVGAFLPDATLIGVAVFSKKSDNSGVEMTRMLAIKNNLFIMNEMFAYAVDNYALTDITAYVDPRWHTEDDRGYLGFDIIETTKPTLWWTNFKKRYQRRYKSKTELVESGGDKNLSKAQLMKNLGYSRIWDCGKVKMRYILP